MDLASLVAQLVENPPAMQETWVWSLGWRYPLAKGTATHSSILAYRIPRSPKELDTTGRLSLFNLSFNSEQPWKQTNHPLQSLKITRGRVILLALLPFNSLTFIGHTHTHIGPEILLMVTELVSQSSKNPGLKPMLACLQILSSALSTETCRPFVIAFFRVCFYASLVAFLWSLLCYHHTGVGATMMGLLWKEGVEENHAPLTLIKNYWPLIMC